MKILIFSYVTHIIEMYLLLHNYKNVRILGVIQLFNKLPLQMLQYFLNLK